MKRTCLYDAHRARGARFIEFGGWEMPVQYRGLLQEHAAVREKAGLFDVSHMGEIEIHGAGALAFCQSVATNDAGRLADGRAQYTLLCAEDGGTIDDTILYRLGAERFLFCVNAGNREACAGWLASHAEGQPGVTVTDRSEDLALVALQGPSARAVVSRLAAPALADLKRFSVLETELAGTTVLAARTGYTGEDGFEFFVPVDEASALWGALLAAGEPEGLEPIGLGARDTLRMEAGLPLYGHELSRQISPLEAGVGWAVKESRGGFPGADVLARQRAEGPPRRLVGLRITGRGIARAEYPVFAGDRQVGHVTSGTRSPTLAEPIALALVASESVEDSLTVEVRGRRITAERVDLPFYRRQ
jgi:aminomethyltransferase